MITETAPAKLNLYLHVGPVRADGFHDLKSLFVFTEDGDRVSAAPAGDITLEIAGPFAPALAPFPVEDNLVVKAARLLKDACGIEAGASMRLEKNLPVAAGVGGGSADAAAALRALVKLWSAEIAEEKLLEIAFRLGADVPACLAATPVDVSGAGEILSPGPALPPLWACLVNSGVEMPTGPVFRAFDAANVKPAAPTAPLLLGASYEALEALMRESRNDLEPPALEIAPQIGAVIDALKKTKGAIIARMSGSGATCFGLYATPESAQAAERAMRERGWWAMASKLIAG